MAGHLWNSAHGVVHRVPVTDGLAWMNELKNNYRDLDYASMKTNTDAYARMKAAVLDATSKKVKLKVTG
jgi:hypothetical protein